MVKVNGIHVAGKGAPGANGKSAYQQAVDGGYTGTEEEFIKKLSSSIVVDNGIIDAKSARISNVAEGTETTDAATIAQLTARIAALESKLVPTIETAQSTANDANTAAHKANTDISSLSQTVQSAGLENGPFLPLAGGTMKAPIKFDNPSGARITTDRFNEYDPCVFQSGFGFSPKGADFTASILKGIANPENANDAANKAYVDNAVANSGGGIPSGVIAMWSGASNAIPSGWALCNGSNGTPDLRNRFIVGAGSSYSVGATGGSDTVTLTVNQMPSHNHGDVYAIGNSTSWNMGSYAGGGTYPQYITTGYSGGNQAHENRPPYYALCFIMKT